MPAADVEASLTYLAMHRQVAAATQHRVLNTLLFLSADVLRRPLDEADQSRPCKAPGISPHRLELQRDTPLPGRYERNPPPAGLFLRRQRAMPARMPAPAR
ncbi:MAG: hypothetical protein MI924_38235 [Chloroflexales bacterium]|nr:hypothetical protein [Chloroflexales bacterium]